MSRGEARRILSSGTLAIPLVSSRRTGVPEGSSEPDTDARRLGNVRALPFPGDDAALVAAMRAGNASAVAAFHDRYERLVTRILVRVLGSEPELADLKHDVFVRALGSLHQLEDPAALRSWLTSVTIFTARSCIQRRSRRRWLRFLPWTEVPELPAPAPSGEVMSALHATYAILAKLPVNQRIAFALRFIEGMELTEVASACEVSLATAKRWIARAEVEFCAMAREHPALAEWVEGGTRWGTPAARSTGSDDT